MKLAIALALLLGGCATLDTGRMTPACRDTYNECLDGCPKPPPNLTNDPSDASIDTNSPSCVETCNQSAQSCR